MKNVPAGQDAKDDICFLRKVELRDIAAARYGRTMKTMMMIIMMMMLNDEDDDYNYRKPVHMVYDDPMREDHHEEGETPKHC